MPGLHLVKGGKALAQIVLPDEPNTLTEQAAEYLAEYVERITSARIATVRESDRRAQSGPRIFLGATKAAQAAGLEVSALKDDGFRLKAVKGDLYVAGRDILFPAVQDVNAFTGCRGTLMGVVRLLEDHGGVGWFLPTPKGEVVPKSPDFSVPDDLDQTEEPFMSYTSMSGVDGYGFPVWANGYRMAVNMHPGTHTWDAAVHNYGDPDELFKEDPTRFAMINGERTLPWDRRGEGVLDSRDAKLKRSPFKYTRIMLCTAHPDFVDMQVKYYSKLFDMGYEYAGYGQSDGYRRCECEKCAAMDGIPESWWEKLNKEYNWDWEVNDDIEVPAAERMWVPIHEFTKRLYEKYPDRKVMILVYNPTYPPSRKIKEFSPNVGVELCRHTPVYLEAFSRFQDRGIYTYWFGTYQVQGITPKGLPHMMAENFRLYRDHGALGIHNTGGGEVWGLEGPSYYAFGRLAWDPDQDVDEVLDRYYRGVYGAAASEMKQFFALLEERIAAGRKQQTREERKVNQERQRRETYYAAAYPEDVLTKLEGHLQAAREKVSHDEIAANWLGLTELQFRHLKIVATGFKLQRRQEQNPTAETEKQLAAIVEARKTFLAELDELKKEQEYLDNWFPGWQLYMQNAPAGGRMFSRVDACPPFGSA